MVVEFNSVELEFTIHNCICMKQEYLTEQQMIIKYCQVLEFQINSHKYFLGVTGIRKQNLNKDYLTYISSHFLRVWLQILSILGGAFLNHLQIKCNFHEIRNKKYIQRQGSATENLKIDIVALFVKVTLHNSLFTFCFLINNCSLL